MARWGFRRCRRRVGRHSVRFHHCLLAAGYLAMQWANGCRRPCQVRAMKLVRTKGIATALVRATPWGFASGLAMGFERALEVTP